MRVAEVDVAVAAAVTVDVAEVVAVDAAEAKRPLLVAGSVESMPIFSDERAPSLPLTDVGSAGFCCFVAAVAAASV